MRADFMIGSRFGQQSKRLTATDHEAGIVWSQDPLEASRAGQRQRFADKCMATGIHIDRLTITLLP